MISPYPDPMEDLRSNLLSDSQEDLHRAFADCSVRSTPSHSRFPHYIYGTSDIVRCPHCSQENIPNKFFQPNSLSWNICGSICLVGCWFGLCLLPICDSNFQEATIYCSLCNKIVARRVQ
ncbi:unnamed protein product [Blepharisma stoltei]|uniref:LITAF domain-containing protein n=1 Tax=Blepharisma stoltei TaxID=1481888 RepID=A0AAU9J8I0_9CILI|nr:unnamed protein product [Blepharisma stoltei]